MFPFYYPRSLYLILTKNRENAQFHGCDRVYSFGTKQSSGMASSPHHFPAGLYDHRVGSIDMILLIKVGPQLCSPMYFFLIICFLLMCGFLPMSPLRCWKTCYPRQKQFPLLIVWYGASSPLLLSM